MSTPAEANVVGTPAPTPLLDRIRPVFHWLRHRGVDLQTPSRRDALNAFTMQQRLLTGRQVKTIIDGGGHHGVVARQYAGMFPVAKVFSFEPTPATFQVLSRNVAGISGIEAVNAAIGDEDGEVEFYIDDVEQANSLLPRSPASQHDRPGTPQHSVRAQVVRLDTFLARKGIDRIDILKLDLEGVELAALRGCGRLVDDGRADLLYIETRFDDEDRGATTFPQLCEYLLPRGYEFFSFYDPRFDPAMQFHWGDAIFVSRELIMAHRARHGYSRR